MSRQESIYALGGNGYAFKTDNRLIANSYRLKWEEFFKKWISQEQQGFVSGRSIIKDILDIERASLKTAAKGENGGIILFDFASAFPSISQQFMLAWMKQIGMPESALNVMTALYDCNRCKVSFRSGIYDGFRMESGVRQGCPISPLIFCICADLLLEKIKRALPTATVRAYADDTAVVVQDLDTDLPVLQQVFEEYSQ